MEIILQENLPSLGYVGDRVRVKNGYARNFLIPRGYAVEAGSRNARVLSHRLQGINAKRAKLKAEAEALGKRMDGLILEFILKGGEGGKTFGSIGAKDVETSLAEKGFAIERTQIRLVEAIKKPGEFKVVVKLHSEVNVTIPVRVTSDAPARVAPAAAEGPEGEAKPAAKRKGKKKAAASEEAGEAAQEQPASDKDSSETKAESAE